jgi:hypothetical protein
VDPCPHAPVSSYFDSRSCRLGAGFTTCHPRLGVHLHHAGSTCDGAIRDFDGAVRYISGVFAAKMQCDERMQNQTSSVSRIEGVKEGWSAQAKPRIWRAGKAAGEHD